MINLGLNRKISNVISKNLNDPESEIYKEISDISGEYTESNDIAKIIENGKDSITSFVNEDITELGNYAFKDCVNLEYVYLPNCTKLGKECFQNCTSLKTLLLPNVTEIDNEFNYFSTCISLKRINLYNYNSNNYVSNYYDTSVIFGRATDNDNRFLKSLIFGTEGNGDGGSLITPNVEIMYLPNFCWTGAWGGEYGVEAKYLILRSNKVLTCSAGGSVNFEIMYVNDDLINDYANKYSTWYNNGKILPITQLPQEIREELELCQIQI